ncbi:hypothetical protein ACKKBF_B02105 [Auxenochlorella protothecoides x Auxenochlorella symbiontica]
MATLVVVPAIAPYSLAAKCGSEIIATCITIYIGESILANEFLAKTKGNRMGWGFVAFGFGMSFGIAITLFNYISAHLNPASCLALWIIGKINGLEFLALSASEFLGAFLGACLVWLHFLPHFKTIPEPPSKAVDDLLLRSRDAMSAEALSIASYNTRGQDKARREGPRKGIGSVLDDMRYFLSANSAHPEDHDELLKVAFGGPATLYTVSPEPVDDKSDGRRAALRRRSVQVADVHRRIKDMDLENFQALLRVPNVGAGQPLPPSQYASEMALEVDRASVKRARSVSALEREDEKLGGGTPVDGAPTPEPAKAYPAPARPGAGRVEPEASKPRTARGAEAEAGPTERLMEARRARGDALFKAAIVADQNAKLSIFATRPAILSPAFNALCEVMCTATLILLYLLLVERGNMLYEPVRSLFLTTVGMWAGFLIFVLILGLGGPTGIAANPARDFGPRVAHWILPIPGKGPSEFYYGWIPLVACFAGGAVAGALFKAIEHLNHSNVPAGLAL